MTVTVFGIRHHGPGSARSLVWGLEDARPDIVLVEGPPEGDGLLPLVAEEGMQPPVALLIYRPDLPRRAVFYPFAVFSPEWQAIQYGRSRSIPVRFCDLPQSVQLAAEPEEQEGTTQEPPEGEPAPPETLEEHIRADPIGVLAEAAGYQESELWWEEQVERRADARGLFQAILEAMRELRAGIGVPPGREARREAHMRQAIRQAEREGFERIAVVCGAWHAPALDERPPAKEDRALLAGLPRARVEATWIPWTNFRLSYRSGYGAGIASPGWYTHLWSDSGNVTVEWIARSAQLLRGERLDAPASGVIDAVRLGETLAALRGRPNPGLLELRESIQTVLCGGNAAPMQLIRQQLEVGDVMGAVPASTPTVPLQRDVEHQQRHLRLRPEEKRHELDLDLRRDLDRSRSVLLHRLSLLGIPWGVLDQRRPGAPASGRRGTFHELWQLQWQVEFVLLLIERNAWGNTLAHAAGSFVIDEARDADLPRLTQLLRGATLAELPGAVATLLQDVQARGAAATDVRHLMSAIPPLAQVVRYGDVRQTNAEQVLPIVQGLFARVVVGLPGACRALDEETAASMADGMADVERSLPMLESPLMQTQWRELLLQLAEREGIHMLVRGWSSRRGFEQGVIDGQELSRLARLALSRAQSATEGASWIEGLLRGSGLGLLHQDGLWLALDGWLQRLDAETFTATLPLVRRAFSGFQPPERRAMGEKVKRLRDAASDDAVPADEALSPTIDHERGRQVIPVLAHILGATPDGD